MFLIILSQPNQSVGVVVEDIAIGAEGLGLDSRAGQIGTVSPTDARKIFLEKSNLHYTRFIKLAVVPKRGSV